MEGCKITVFIFAYNHEQYIAQGIESVLEQKTNFPYELHIYDDYSTDNTCKIANDYCSKYPDKVKLVKNTRNHGINYQFKKAILSTHTKYVCITGGDDYWIDEYKLQKQYDYLESNNKCSLVHTNNVTLNEITGEQSIVKKIWKWKMPNDRIDRLCSLYLDKMIGGYPLLTSSCFRLAEVQRCIIEHPEIIDSSVVGEGTTILTAIALYGEHIDFLPDATVVYRVRKGSLSHKKSILEQVEYLFSYSILRINIIKGLKLEHKHYIKFVKELFCSDIMMSISLNSYQNISEIANRTLSDIELKKLFDSCHKRYFIINKYHFLYTFTVWFKILKKKFL